MILTEEQKQRIVKDLMDFADKQYANNEKKDRKKLGQFFTPPQLVIRMIEKFTSINDDILDPCIGSGNLIVGCIIAGADPKRCYGIEFDAGQAELCRDRLEQYGVPRENIVTGDCLDNKTWEKLPCYKKEFKFGGRSFENNN